jgi:hypothetical protein
MSSTKHQQQRKPRGDYSIPPLPQSHLRVDKENKGRISTDLVGDKGSSPLPLDGKFALSQHRSKSTEGASSPKQSTQATGRRGVLAPLQFSDNSLLSSTTAVASDKPGKEAATNLLGSASRKPLSTVQSTRRRVLRYRETMESLFCLTLKCSSEHWQLCREIVDGSLADDASTWRRVLQLALEQDEQNRGPTASNTSQGMCERTGKAVLCNCFCLACALCLTHMCFAIRYGIDNIFILSWP